MTVYPSEDAATESPSTSTDPNRSHSSVDHAAGIVSLAAMVAAVASVVRNVVGSVKDSLDIKKHFKDGVKQISNPSRDSNNDPETPSPKDRP
jgi:hypothetical protein